MTTLAWPSAMLAAAFYPESNSQDIAAQDGSDALRVSFENPQFFLQEFFMPVCTS